MAGTYFYHSHVGFQSVSIQGPLIVIENGTSPVHYDDERIILLGDIFNQTDESIEQGLLANPFVWSGETQGLLVNGFGQLPNQTAAPGCSPAEIEVDPNKTYRFRFIGGTALSFVSLAIEGHSELKIIEADGAYTQPYTVPYLQIGPGQRFSVLLSTKQQKDQANSKYYIQMETRDRPALARSYAILKYTSEGQISDNYTSGANSTPPIIPPLTLPDTNLDWLDYALRPLHPNGFPSLAEVTRRVTIHMHQVQTGSIYWTQNNYSWTTSYPKEPYLVSLYKNDGVEFPSYTRALENHGIDPETRAFPAQIGEIIELVIQNTASDSGMVRIFSCIRIFPYTR